MYFENQIMRREMVDAFYATILVPRLRRFTQIRTVMDMILNQHAGPG